MNEPQPTTVDHGSGQDQSEKSFSTLVNEYQKEQIQELEDDTLETPEDAEEGDESPEDGTQDDEVDVQSLEEALKQARNVSIKKDQLRKEARAESRQLQEILQAQVESDPKILTTIQAKSPELAETLAQDVYGMSAQEVLSQGKGEHVAGLSKEELRSELEALLAEKEAGKEQQSVEQTELKFFQKLGMSPDNPSFKRVLKEYQKFSPRNTEEASIFLHAAYEKTTGKKAPVVVGDMNAVPAVSQAKTGASFERPQRKGPSKKMQLAAKTLGISQKQLQEYMKKRS